MDTTDLARRFAYHPPKSPETVHAHETVREACGYLAEFLNGLLPEGREKALAITHLESVMMWSNAAIARQVD